MRPCLARFVFPVSQECLSLAKCLSNATGLTASISHQPGKPKGNQSPMCVLSFQALGDVWFGKD